MVAAAARDATVGVAGRTAAWGSGDEETSSERGKFLHGMTDGGDVAPDPRLGYAILNRVQNLVPNLQANRFGVEADQGTADDVEHDQDVPNVDQSMTPLVTATPTWA